MSLFKQLAIMLTLFLGIILASVMVLNFKTASEFIQNQLYTDAKNTAHSLGLSLSKVADPNDPSSMETMINAIFDSGYYQSIELDDLDGKVVYERHNDMLVSDVPQWFISAVKIENASATSNIMIGWSQFGTLHVSGHTGNAYRQLYSTLINLIETFCMMGIVVFAFLYILLSFSLKSLKRIKDQAKAIIDNQFIFEEKIPFTTEFRSVTVAMNAMVGKVKDIFERENETLRRYHELLYKDSETKLYNRRYVVSKLPDYLQADTSNCVGMYALCSFDELDHFKKEFGYEAYHHLMIDFSNELNSQFSQSPSSMIARLNESDFFVVLPAQSLNEIHKGMSAVMEQLKEQLYKEYEGSSEYLIFGCALGNYSEKDTLKSLFSRADYSVTHAKLRANFTIDIAHEEEYALVLGREEWRQELLLSLEESRMLLAFQSVVSFHNDASTVLHEEIFLRLLDREGVIHSAGYFIPVATSLGLVEQLDRYMISKVLKHLKDDGSTVSMALNLSSDFVTKYTNMEWLKEQLSAFAKTNTTPLWFEVSNSIALSEIDAVKNISMLVKSFGHRFGIDHFAIPESGAGYLQVIRPDYVKSNGSYLSDMMIDKENGNSRESFHNLAKSLGISIIAIMIENTEQMEELRQIGLNNFQGSFVAPVAML
ncbi:LapD/MoxY N-terminal periplasmic domain-containing protein [Sulfuricurvum sp.]|uniref:bifunctional diguanylate cyclase/phosphodiesterase n=1 Tax=Sulfuricurvum sp. TaxID=2025608 RepID=UPI00260B52D0|nr:LapD/MoxY N-terminal periplasmic domain-containing protein [Sulfuricurvum sp.]MDD4949467.1 LapD/MoxY N-terminal periplasmic domain-containing protein [Sulfuricurvum sp.]